MKITLTCILAFALLVSHAGFSQNQGFPLSQGPAVTVSPINDLSVTASNNASYTRIFLLPGTYNVTNSIRLREGQSLIGSGYGNTFLKFWGYAIGGSQAVGDYWVCVLLNTNSYVANLDIRGMLASNSVFQACIGFHQAAGNTGGTNFLVENVSMHGDTDNIYIDNGAQWSGNFVNCFCDGHWDTCVLGLGENSVINIVAPQLCVRGPNSNTSAASAPARAFRVTGLLGATNQQINVIGGNVRSGGEFLLQRYLPVAFQGTHFLCESNGPWFRVWGGTLDFYGLPMSYSKVVNQAAADIPTITTIHDLGPQPDGGEEQTSGDPAIGAAYYNTNSAALRFFDGFSWTTLTGLANTNQLIVTGAASAAFNGIYTWKTNGISGFDATTVVWTNGGGKFLMWTTNTGSDLGGPGAAISSNQSVSDGLETSTAFNLMERGWSTAAIRVRRVQGPSGNLLVDTDRAYGITNGYYVCRSEKALTKSSATTVFNFTVATNQSVSLRVFASTRCNNGTDYQIISDNFLVNAVSKAGVITSTVSTVTPSATALSTGTFTDTWTAVANGNLSVDLKCNAVPSLTPGTLNCHWRVEVDSDSSVILTP